MKGKTYDPVRGVRIPASLWKQIQTAARKKHLKPSDVIRHAIITSLSKLEAAA